MLRVLRTVFRSRRTSPANFFQTTPNSTKRSIGLYTETIAGKSSRDPYWTYKVGFLGAIPLTTLYLGWWQLQRLEWKENILATIKARIQAEPIVLNGHLLSNELDPNWEYRLVLARGEYLHDREILLGPRTLDNQLGYYVITPFRLDTGYIVLVKRGWVSRDKKNPASRRKSQVEGTVTIKAQVRLGEKGNRFTPTNVPEKNQWFYTNLAEMANYTGSLPILIDEISDENTYGTSKLIQDGIPVPRPPEIHLSNNHAEYAFTWLSLSVLTTIMTVMFVKRGGPKLPSNSEKMRQIKF